MLNNAIKESKNPEVGKLKEEIDAVKKQRGDTIAKVKENRRRLNYKEAESVAIGRLLEIEKGKDKDNAKRKKIGYLKRLKNQLEFKISTEAQSLTAEKDLVRKIEEINKELNVAYKVIRLERKTELVKSDIEECRKNINEFELKIAEHDKKLDELYDKLRKLLGIERAKRVKPATKKRVQSQQMPQEINLEDIAVITKKSKKATQDEDADA
jgi:uncharacterized coiled-coil DUF342 family protein